MMKDRRNQRTCCPVELPTEEGHRDGRAEGAPSEDWLDVMIRLALQVVVGDAEPSAAAWTEIQESMEARHQTRPTREGE